MDIIIGLPKSEGYGSIIVVVDRLSKYVTFIAAPKDCTTEETTRLFLKNVVKYWGLSKFIISDRDSRFTGKFWMELFKLKGTELHFSTSFTSLRDDVEAYVRTCLVCQQDKVEQHQPRGLLEPLPIAELPWESHYGHHHRPT